MPRAKRQHNAGGPAVGVATVTLDPNDTYTDVCDDDVFDEEIDDECFTCPDVEEGPGADGGAGAVDEEIAPPLKELKAGREAVKQAGQEVEEIAGAYNAAVTRFDEAQAALAEGEADDAERAADGLLGAGHKGKAGGARSDLASLRENVAGASRVMGVLRRRWGATVEAERRARGEVTPMEHSNVLLECRTRRAAVVTAEGRLEQTRAALAVAEGHARDLQTEIARDAMPRDPVYFIRGAPSEIRKALNDPRVVADRIAVESLLRKWEGGISSKRPNGTSRSVWPTSALVYLASDDGELLDSDILKVSSSPDEQAGYCAAVDVTVSFHELDLPNRLKGLACSLRAKRGRRQ